MKALTLWQPWATLVAIGAKEIETRSWYTDYRGPLAIHAAKTFPNMAKDLCDFGPFRTALTEAGYANKMGIIATDRLPTGVIVATCQLAAVIQIPDFQPPLEPELSFGDYYTPGRYAWILESVVALPEPIPAHGHQRLWEWVYDDYP